MAKFVSLRLSEEEKKTIEQKAHACCLTRSAYIRKTALGIVPRSKMDQQALLALSHLHGDIGRVGGLLKLWLSRDEDAYWHQHLNVRELLHELNDLKSAIHALIGQLGQ